MIPLSVNPPELEPMQFNQYDLTQEERALCLSLRLCWFCGGSGHRITSCPVRPAQPTVSTFQSTAAVAHFTLTDVLVISASPLVSVKDLIVSGAAGILMSQRLLTSPSSDVH